MKTVNEIWKSISNGDAYADLLDHKTTIGKRIEKVSILYADQFRKPAVIKSVCDVCNDTGIYTPNFPFIHEPCYKCKK